MATLDDKLKIVVGSGSSRYTMPYCSSYKITLTDTDLDSGRNIKAVMVRNRVRANMYKLEFSYSLTDDDDGQDMLEAITPESFPVTFYSPYTQSRITKTMYAGDKTMSWVMVRDDDGDFNLKLQSLAFNFIEI